MGQHAELAYWYKNQIKALRIQLQRTQRRDGHTINALRRQIKDLEYRLAHMDTMHTDTQPKGYGTF